MKQFMDEHFLLENEVGEYLYRHHAAKMPIFDFHCHLIPREIYEDKKYDNLTEVWLGRDGYGDHYKWRLMREFGIPEEYITGSRTPEEKFAKYAEVIPYMVGNPIYQWTHLELQRYFGIEELLSPRTAERIYAEAGAKLQTMSTRKMMELFDVRTVFTTDDPTDDLRYHELMSADPTLKTDVRPCFRPDKALNIERETFLPWLRSLERVSGTKITDLDGLLKALHSRLEFFAAHGCRASDHALDTVPSAVYDQEAAAKALDAAISGRTVDKTDLDAYKTVVLARLGEWYQAFGIIQQYHIGANRNANSKMYGRLGPDTGYDCIKDDRLADELKGLLDLLERRGHLPKTVLYTLNPSQNEVLATLMNCYQEEGIRGKIQFGAAWWFNDHYDGMSRQLETLASVGLLSCFIGMLTDSRSFLSYPRHEYFRRLLCNRLGDLVERGLYPDDRATLGQIVEDVSYNNAVKYFGM